MPTRRNSRAARYGSYNSNATQGSGGALGIYGASKAPAGAYRTEETYGVAPAGRRQQPPVQQQRQSTMIPANAPAVQSSPEMPFIAQQPPQQHPMPQQKLPTRPPQQQAGPPTLPSFQSPQQSFEGVATILDDGAMNSEMYQIFAQYFSNPVLVKAKADPETGNSIYYAHVRSQTRSGYRYLVVITEPSEYPLGSRMNLADLEWLSLQTREVPEPIPNVPTIMYDINRRSPLAALHVEAVNRTKQATTYLPTNPNNEVQGHGSKYQPSSVDTGVDPDLFPVMVTMIVTNDEPMQYQPRGTLASCLETYQTIVTIRQ